MGTGEAKTALPVTLVLDKNGKTVERFDGLIEPEKLRAAVAKAQNAG
jgi:glutathione peroxidase-family protein